MSRFLRCDGQGCGAEGVETPAGWVTVVDGVGRERAFCSRMCLGRWALPKVPEGRDVWLEARFVELAKAVDEALALRAADGRRATAPDWAAAWDALANARHADAPYTVGPDRPGTPVAGGPQTCAQDAPTDPRAHGAPEVCGRCFQEANETALVSLRRETEVGAGLAAKVVDLASGLAEALDYVEKAHMSVERRERLTALVASAAHVHVVKAGCSQGYTGRVDGTEPHGPPDVCVGCFLDVRDQMFWAEAEIVRLGGRVKHLPERRRGKGHV